MPVMQPPTGPIEVSDPNNVPETEGDRADRLLEEERVHEINCCETLYRH
jgi:hypothetical protein